MRVGESVVLPLPRRMGVMAFAAVLFVQQYGSGVRIEVRGQVRGKGQRVHIFREWVEVGELDMELDLLGVRDPGYAAADDGEEEEDGLRWVVPTGPGEYRLSERTERIGGMREGSAGEDEGKKKRPHGCDLVQTNI